jgi:hypothetical protein
VRVTNATDSKREQFKLGWTQTVVGGAAEPAWLGAPIDAYVPPGQSRVFALPIPKEGRAEQILLRGDDEAFDNVAYIIPPAQQKASVLWIGTDVKEDPRQPLFFLQRAFAETPRIAVQVTPVAPSTAPAPADLKAASVIFITDAISAEMAAALREEANAGKTLVVMPKNTSVGATLGALLGREPVPLAEGQTGNYAMFAEIDFQHPLFAPFADPRYSDFTKIHVWKYRKLDASAVPGARVIAKFDSGDPGLVEVPVGRGRVYFLATGWHPEDSQLAVSSKFVPLVWSILEQTGGVASFSTQYSVGENVTLPSGHTASAVRAPGGATHSLEAGATVFGQAAQPGIYELSGAGRAQSFAVNLDPNESRTTPLANDELEQMGVPVARAKTPGTETVENKTVLQGIEAENRQKLWRWFIVATLAVLLAESVVAGWTARRSALQTQEVAS